MNPARYKVAADRSSYLVMCPKPDANGHMTCPGTFGIAVRSAGKVIMRMYGILRPDAEGVYAAGRTRLRRRYVRGSGPDDGRDYGPRGERAGAIVRDFPVVAECPRCGEEAEIDPGKGLP